MFHRGSPDAAPIAGARLKKDRGPGWKEATPGPPGLTRGRPLGRPAALPQPKFLEGEADAARRDDVVVAVAGGLVEVVDAGAVVVVIDARVRAPGAKARSHERQRHARL